MGFETHEFLISTPPAHPSLNAYADISNMARHLNSHVAPRPLAQPYHMAVTGEVSGPPMAYPVVLKLNKQTRPMIALTKAVSTAVTTKIIEEANKRWGIKLLPENVRICSMPDPLAPKTADGRRSFPLPRLSAQCSSD
jgi:hypothetical protein